jgi:hypothetical protein
MLLPLFEHNEKPVRYADIYRNLQSELRESTPKQINAKQFELINPSLHGFEGRKRNFE